MSTPADQPVWEGHPLWHDRALLDDIRQQMWIEIQKTMFPGKPRRSFDNPSNTELTVVGGASAQDVFNEAVSALLRYVLDGDVDWAAVANTIAHHRAVAAVRRARKHRNLPDGSEIGITSLQRADEDGEPVFSHVESTDESPDDAAVERALRDERLVAFRETAYEILPPRDRDIVFRAARGETYVAIARVMNLTPQRVGQIDRGSLRKINAALCADPKYRRLYEPKGGTSDD